MTQKNRESLQRAIGIIEGASFGASAKVQDALALACEIIDSILDDEEEQGKSEDKNAKASF